MALTEQTGAELGMPFLHAQDAGGAQMPVVAFTPGPLTYTKGAKLGVQFLYAQDGSGAQMPVVVLHPESPGGGGTGPGGDGEDGDNGWTPVMAAEARGQDVVLKIVDWAGGSGTKPQAGVYLGPTGLVATAALAQNVRGATGAAGTGPSRLSFSIFIGGTPNPAQVVASLILPMGVSLGLGDVSVHVETAATTPTNSLQILLNGTVIGSISSTGVVTLTTNPTPIGAGQRLGFKSVGADATWGGITIGANLAKT